MKKFTSIVMAGILCFCCYSVFSQETDQERIVILKQLSNSPLIKNLPEPAIDQAKEVNVLVQGDVDKIKKLVENTGGTYKYSTGDITAIRISINKLNLIKNNPFVKKIEYQPSVGNHILAESMRSQANVDSIYKGWGKLLKGYNGTGVVIGMIDNGIDYDHADFRDSLGKTRIKYIWDTDQAGIPPSGYAYGNECDSIEIALGICGATKASHGTATSGIAFGNGLDSSLYRGVAPGVDIIMVDATNSNLIDAANYIFKMADNLGKPCVINASYAFVGGHGVLEANSNGAHDGTDLSSQALSNLLNAKKGRAFVCAAGNDGGASPFHLSYKVTADTNFTWFKYNPTGYYGFGWALVELWGDTADLSKVSIAIGADKITPVYEYRGSTKYLKIKDFLSSDKTDTLKSKSGKLLAIYYFSADIIDDKYYVQIFSCDKGIVAGVQIDSTQYNYRLILTGNGKFDSWSSSTSTCNKVSDYVSSGLPDTSTFPPIVKYKRPDTLISIIPGPQCSPNALTVGVYNSKTATIGERTALSARGYNRIGDIKPDLMAPAGSITTPKVGGGYVSNSGATSYSSPVVAGIAALYFQKYPTASYNDVNNAIRMSAKEDSFTGTTPNPTWGYGKVNGYAALTMFKPTLAISSTTDSICAKDTVTLSTTGSVNYWWAKSSTPNDTIAANKSVKVSPATTSTYILTGVDTNGFSKKDSVKITVTPLAVYTVSVTGDTVCFGETTSMKATGATFYKWDDANLDSVGTGSTFSIVPDSTTFFRVTGWDNNTCAVEDYINITVLDNPAVYILASEDTVCNGESIILSAGGADWLWWDDAAWDSIGMGDSIIVIPDSSTMYYVSGQDSNGCWDVDSIWIVVHSLPVVSGVAIEDTICKGDTVLLAGGGADWHWWFDVAWDSVASNDSAWVWPDSSTSYYLTGVDSNGCWNADSVWLMVHAIPGVSGAAFEDTVCKGDTVLLAGSGADWYWWFNAAWDSVASNDSAWVSPGSSTSYYLTGADSNGCWNADSVWITVNTLNLIVSSTDNNYCPEDTGLVKDSVTLSAVGGVFYSWENAGGDTISTTSSLKVFPQVTTNYYVAAWDSVGCLAYDSVKVDVKTRPFLTGVKLTNDTICGGESTTIQFSTDAVWNMLFDENWNYLTGTWFPYFVITPDSSAKYYVLVANVDSCWSMDSVDVVVKPAPNIDLGPDTVCTNCSGIELDAGNEGTDYLWSTGDTTQTVTVKDTGSYSVTVTGSNGCTSSDNININWPTGLIKGTIPSKDKIIVSPNPYEHITKINYELEKSGKVEVSVYNILGNKIHTLVNEYQVTGTYFYEFSAGKLGYSSGVYILRMNVDGGSSYVVRLMETGK